MSKDKVSFMSVIKTMGLVFGDIGTSPIYTFTVIFLTLQVNTENVLSILSLIIWTLLLIVTTQYAFLAMSLSKQGEGGAIVLNEIFKKLLKSSRAILFSSFLTYIGISLLIGDSVITPAMSILSAVEGMQLIPGLEHIAVSTVMFVTVFITIVLFIVQRHGTEKISRVFGPIMALWFLILGVAGLAFVVKTPQVFMAFNPYYGINFLLHHGFAGFFVLSEVILCATGAEALYADMGHLGRKPIIRAWSIVLVAILLNYLGQGAFLLAHPEAKNILFAMVLSINPIFYVPFLILSVLATIIASQAMISGLFSVVYQGINTNIFPLFKINYTSKEISSQIYIGVANWFLLFFVILVILFFRKSANLAAAYGLAVTGTITITAVMMTSIFFLRKMYKRALLSAFLLCLDVCFLMASSVKIPHGAYWSILISMIPFLLILVYTQGQKLLYGSMRLMDKEVFLEKYAKLCANITRIKGTALFFSRGIDKVPPYIIKTMFTNNILYTDNIFVQINKMSEAYELNFEIEEITQGLSLLKINAGYMEIVNLEDILKQLDIKEKVIFYGVEDIEAEGLLIRIFAFIKKVTPTFVSFYNLPAHKIHGVITKVKPKIKKQCLCAK